VGSGFILTPDGVSTQIDILVCDDSAPILFRDGDFLIATADCVRAAVEVKTKLTAPPLLETLIKLNDVSTLMRRRCVPSHPFLGLFCYEAALSKPVTILNALQKANGKIGNYEIRALCFGDSQFYRFWEYDPSSKNTHPYYSWHAYELLKIAAGYFIHNLIEFLFPRSFQRAEGMWYPIDGIEKYCVETKPREEKKANNMCIQ